MKISSYENPEDFNDIESLMVIVKCVPFENSYVPAMVIVSPDDEYVMTIDELSCLMDGIEIAKSKIDGIIDYILKTKVFRSVGEDEEEEGEEEDDTWESDS
jgi:hypothetical protein